MSIPDWHVEGTMERAQYEALSRALRTTGYSLSKTSAQLRISRSTAYRLVKRYELDASKEQRLAAASSQTVTQKVAPEIIFDGTNYVLVNRHAA